jgi:hypothetical protein
MRMPATVEMPGSAVGGFGTTARRVADPRRTGVRLVPLPVAFVALATLDLRLGSFRRLADSDLRRSSDSLNFPEAPRLTNRLSFPVSISSRFATLFLPAVFFTAAFFAIAGLLLSAVQFGCPSMG